MIIEDGTYIGGTVTAPHSDWLILKAETKDGVTIDLSTTGLKLGAGTSKIVFVGFNFVNGMIAPAPGVSDIRFWYVTGTFPANVWHAQYTAAGGHDPVTARTNTADRRVWFGLDNVFPNFWRQGPRSTTVRSTGIGVYGSNLHDFGGTTLYWWDTNDVEVIGTKIWDGGAVVGGVNYDPAETYPPDWLHNGGSGIFNVQGYTVADSSINLDDGTGAMLLSGDAGSSSGIDVNRVWLWSKVHKNSKGFYLKVTSGRSATGTISNVKIVNMLYPVIEEIDGEIIGWPRTFGNPDPDGRLPTYSFDQAPPSGITPINGRMSVAQQEALLDHVDNPANIWRAAHPYNSYRSYLGISTLSSR